MAKTEKPVEEATGQQAAEQAAEPVETAQTEKKVTVRLPLTKEDTRPVYVRVNGRKWGIPRGKPVQVPECVAEVLEHSEEQILESIRYSEAMQNQGGMNL